MLEEGGREGASSCEDMSVMKCASEMTLEATFTFVEGAGPVCKQQAAVIIGEQEARIQNAWVPIIFLLLFAHGFGGNCLKLYKLQCSYMSKGDKAYFACCF